MDPSGNADYSESSKYGRNRGKTSVSVNEPDVLTRTFGPRSERVQIGGPNGEVFQNVPSFRFSGDKIQAIVQFWRFSLSGRFEVMANGSTLPANNAVDWVNTHFWPKYYAMKWYASQRRDGYRANKVPSDITDPLVPRYAIEGAVAAYLNSMALAQVSQNLLVNTAMRSCINAFDDINPDAISRCVERTSKLYIPAWMQSFLDYWAPIYQPYPGGPLVINLWDMQQTEDLLVPTNAFNAWGADLPDLHVAADVQLLIDDINNMCNCVTEPYALNDGDDISDLRNMHSLMDMMGDPTARGSIPEIKPDPRRFAEQFKLTGFIINDTKGVGNDTWKFWPDFGGSEDTMISMPILPECPITPGDDLFWMGAKGIYAYEADDTDTENYADSAEDLTALGMVCRVNGNDSMHNVSLLTNIYTEEDEWTDLLANLDLTAAAGLQALLWQFPFFSIHPKFWVSIRDEEDEENYRINFDQPEVQIPVGTWSRHFRRKLIEWTGLPFEI
jgi:hypothetical protein